MQEMLKQYKELLERIRSAAKALDIDADEVRLAELQADMADPDFWNDPARAADVSRQAAEIQKHIERWLDIEKRTIDEMFFLEEDADYIDQASTAYNRLLAEYQRMEFELKMSGDYDKNSAIVSIFAGTGGTDAQDWAEMLLRMYLRYCERVGYIAAILDQSPGEEAGIKSVTFEVNGRFAYGRLRSEKGVHRLVRLSPFNSDNLRQTSFALVDVLPQIETAQEFEIDPKDLRIDVYRAGGHGGQSVNTTDSAVRITHLPTNTVVAIQNERSQLQNRDKAMAVLKSRLTALMLAQQKEAVSDLRGEAQSAAWGNQIRSYVLHPYNMVKDHRTGEQTSDTQHVLDGEIDRFIDAFLMGQVGSDTDKK